MRQGQEQDRAAMTRMWESNATQVRLNNYSICEVLLWISVDDNYRNGDIRLVGGPHNWEGRVEIFWNGIWGTISDADWGMSEAQVVCKQLQLPSEGNPKC